MARSCVCAILFAATTVAGCTQGGRVETGGQSGAQLHSGMPVDAPTSIVYVNSCNIEDLNGTLPTDRALPLEQGAPLNVSGWAVDETTHQAPTHVFVLVQSAESKEFWWAPISGRLPRQDVARAKNSTLLSGFKASLDTSLLPPGEYLVLTLFWQERPSQICDNGRRIMIK